MLIGARNAMLSGAALPYDAEVEYLQSSGVEYINTGVMAKGTDMVLEMDMSKVSGMKTYASFMGCVQSSRRFGFNNLNVNGIQFLGPLSSGWWQMNIQDQSGWSTRTKIAVENNNGTLYAKVNGVTRETHAGFLVDYTIPVWLFAGNGWPAGDGKFIGKVYGAKITLDGVAVWNAIPVRFTNENGVTEGAMFDRVSGTLFRNAGTGAFVIGPDASAANGGGV